MSTLTLERPPALATSVERVLRVEAGALVVVAGDEELIATPGEEVAIPAGLDVRTFSGADEPLVVCEELREVAGPPSRLLRLRLTG